ncbi:MAG TPA: hypothetical protein VFW87_15315 [Pirellulales bacterium]|nr:hypothetical protein [Pirellulales bacterium]
MTRTGTDSKATGFLLSVPIGVIGGQSKPFNRVPECRTAIRAWVVIAGMSQPVAQRGVTTAAADWHNSTSATREP